MPWFSGSVVSFTQNDHSIKISYNSLNVFWVYRYLVLQLPVFVVWQVSAIEPHSTHVLLLLILIIMYQICQMFLVCDVVSVLQK